MIGTWEFVAIVATIAILFGPGIVKRTGKTIKKTGDAYRQGLEGDGPDDVHNSMRDDSMRGDGNGLSERRMSLPDPGTASKRHRSRAVVTVVALVIAIVVVCVVTLSRG